MGEMVASSYVMKRKLKDMIVRQAKREGRTFGNMMEALALRGFEHKLSKENAAFEGYYEE